MRLNVKKGKFGGWISNFVVKKENEQDEYGFIQIGFKKDKEPQINENQIARINITDGFLSGYKSTKDNSIKPKIVAMEYEIIEVKDIQREEVDKEGLSPVATVEIIPDEDLPF